MPNIGGHENDIFRKLSCSSNLQMIVEIKETIPLLTFRITSETILKPAFYVQEMFILKVIMAN